MIFDTIKFARAGLSFDYRASLSNQELRQRLKQHSFLRVLIKRKSRIVARVREAAITLYCLRVPIIQLGRPVLYLSITASDRGVQVSGKFTFSYLARVVLWLNVVFFFSMLAYGGVRLVMAYIRDLDIIFYVFAVSVPIASTFLSYLIFSWIHSTWKKYRTDMSEIAECLQKISGREN